jgi:hypothetical protein
VRGIKKVGWYWTIVVVGRKRLGCPRAAAWVKEQGGVRKCLAPRVPPTDDLNDWERKETLVRMMIHGPEKVRGWEFTQPGPLTLEHCATIKTLMFGDGDLCRKCGGSGHFAAQCKHAKLPWLEFLDRMLLHKANLPRESANLVAQAALAFKHTSKSAAIASKPRLHGESTKKESGGGAARGGHAGNPRSQRACGRCGRDSHSTSSCYATTDASGEPLSSSSDDDEESETSLGGVSHGLRHRRCERCGRDSHLTRNCYATTLASGEPLSTSDDEYDKEWDD